MSADIWCPELHDGIWRFKERRYLNYDIPILSSFLVILVIKMEKMSVCLWNKWCWWKILAFAPKMCSADAKCEYLLYLLYKMDDIDTKSKRLFSIFNIQ